MHKKFVSLDDPSPSENNPYYIRTWDPPAFRIDSPQPNLFETAAIGLAKNQRKHRPNFEDILKSEFEKTNQLRDTQKFKKKCDPHDAFSRCVRLQHCQKELLDNAIVREKILYLQRKIGENDCRHVMKTKDEDYNLIKFESLTDIGPVKQASPSPSAVIATIPSKRVLALKKAKSGICINETPYNVDEADLAYNPRNLQNQLHDQYSVFDIIAKNDKKYVKLAGEHEGEHTDNILEITSMISVKDSDGKTFLQAKTTNNPEMRQSVEAIDSNSTRIRGGDQHPLVTPLRNRVDVLIFSEFRMKPTLTSVEKFATPRQPKSIAAIYSAYAHSFIEPLQSWNMSRMMEVFETGKKILEKSVNTNYQNCNSPFDMDPYIVIQKTPMTIACRKLSRDIQDFQQTLEDHFMNKNSGIVRWHNDFVLIWKQCSDFFVFNPHSRNRDTLLPDDVNGYPTLIRCSRMWDLVELLSAGCDLNSNNNSFELYDIQLQDFNIVNKSTAAQKHLPVKNYAVVNDYYAVIRGKDGLRMNPKAKINASLLISCLVRIYADIEDPWLWTGNVLDQLRKYFMSLFKEQVEKDKLKTYTVLNLKPIHRIGSFRTEIVTIPFDISGKLSDCPTFRSSQLSSAICHFFSCYDNALIEIDSFAMAAWKHRNVFYVYDPFCRSVNGLIRDDGPKGAACLQMHLNLQSLCRIVYENARKISPNGSFFIHALKLIRTRIVHHSKVKTEKVTFPMLLLDYPVKCQMSKEYVAQKSEESVSRSGYLNKCLSILSVSPCERTCSETEVIEMEQRERLKQKKFKQSLEQKIENAPPLPDDAKIPWYDSYDIVEPIVDELVDHCCKVAREYDESLIARARKVLFRSDRENLEGLLKSVTRGEDYDNYYAEFSKTPTIAKYAKTLENELKIDTSFELIPDGDWIVVGSKKIVMTEEDLDLGSLSAFVTTILAGKYNIKFWSAQLLDYSIRSAIGLRSSIKTAGDLLLFLTRSKIPNMEINKRTLNVSVDQVAFGFAKDLKKILSKALEKYSNLILVLNTFSCAILQRSVFYFLFIGHPCNVMGFRRRKSGVPVMVRTLDLDSVVRRINANRFNTSLSQQATIFGITTKDITEVPKPFVALTPSEEELMYNQEKDQLAKKEDHKQMKVLFLKDELQKEKQRISAFRKDRYTAGEDYYGILSEEEDDYEEEDPEPVPKHLPGQKLSSTESINDELDKTDWASTKRGYQYYEPDYNFKIQGSTSLDDRFGAENINQIRPCHFASLLAIMHAIHIPLKEWDFRRIDMVIEKAMELDNLTQERTLCCSRRIDNVFVDDFVYRLAIRREELISGPPDTPIHFAITRISRSRRYFIIQFSNMSVAVHRADFYHLFDPYRTLEVVKESASNKKPQPLINVKPAKDGNTASWISFPNLALLLTYIEERINSQKWQHEFNIYVVNILSVKKVPKRHRLIQMLMSSPIKRAPLESEHQVTGLQTEPLAWIDTTMDYLLWSPLLEVNMNKDKRGSVFTKWKSFDIELSGKLFSLWGNIHPRSAVFGERRGKQILAINVLACCMAHAYQVEEWTPNIIDTIVVNGDKYFQESINDILRKDYELTLEDLNTEFVMNKLCRFGVHLEMVAYGFLYDSRPKIFNLSQALSYFFMDHRYGVIQCMRKSLCFGKTRLGYFIFDCQSHGQPLFDANQGCAYILLVRTLDILLYCMTMTLNIPYYNMEFIIHAVVPGIKKSVSSTSVRSSKTAAEEQGETEELPSAEEA